MGYPLAAGGGWHAWTATDGSLGGFVTKYSPPAKSSTFSFVTIRGAGHMVPSTQPQYAYDLASTYIGGGEL